MPVAVRDSFALVLQDVVARAGELAIRAVAAAVIVVLVVAVGLALRPLVRRALARGGRPSRTRVFTALWTTVVVVVALLLSATLAFPSVRVADVLASLGIVSVAVGFAFKDVLENLLAGVLLLLRDPFRTGDQIQVAGYEGTVEGVTVRETLLRTYDGQLVLIPNAQVYINPLEVRTHRPFTRNAFRLQLDAGCDPDVATAAMTASLQQLRPNGAPAPQVVVLGAESGALEVEARLWTPAVRADRTEGVSRAVIAALAALTAAGIRLDEPRTVLLESDET